jgi:plasmid replication initiation protein
MAALNQDKRVSQIVHFKAYDMLKATNRMTNGQAYEGLVSALTRLRGTTITTNIITGNQEVTRGFGLIESFEIVRKTREGRMQEVEIKLSDWVFNAIRHKEVLTLHRDYFRLRKPLERRIYELARKHCGMQSSWKIGLQRLQEKCGSTSTLKEFRRLVQKIVVEDETHSHMPDYALSLEDDMVTFSNRRTIEAVISSRISKISLDPEAYHDARTVAPGWDIYVLEREWRQWMHEYDVEPPRNATKAFIGFCRKHAQKHGRP